MGQIGEINQGWQTGSLSATFKVSNIFTTTVGQGC